MSYEQESNNSMEIDEFEIRMSDEEIAQRQTHEIAR